MESDSDSEMEMDYAESSEDDDGDEFYEDIDESGEAAKKRPNAGRPLKPFSTNKRTQQRAKLRDPYLAIEAASKKLGIPFQELLGLLGKMHYNKEHGYTESDKLWVKLFEKISDGENPLETHSIQIERAIYLAENVVKGQSKWNKLRNCLAPVIELPSLDAMKKFKKKYHPKLGKNIFQF